MVLEELEISPLAKSQKKIHIQTDLYIQICINNKSLKQYWHQSIYGCNVKLHNVHYIM